MNIKQLTEKMNSFVQEKGWYEGTSKRPQTSQNLAISISLEAAEILELFQWNDKQPSSTDALSSELADVALYLLQLASVNQIDLEKAILAKLNVNRNRHWD
jgi:NTP pyrophosphatase (non-canonical NTP hydrolase)